MHGGTVCMPNVVLKSVLMGTSDRLNICHINAGSIYPKIDEFRSLFKNVNVDIIVASETWFKSYRTNKSVEITDFEVLRNDRHAKKSGGVAIYVNKTLNFKIVKASERIASEFLFIEIIFPDSKILFGAYYKAPKIKELDVLENILSELTVSYSDIIIFGYFNENQNYMRNGLPCPYCVNGTCTKCLFASSKALVYHQLDLRSIGQNSSMIDLILTNKQENESSTKTVREVSTLKSTQPWFNNGIVRALMKELSC